LELLKDAIIKEFEAQTSAKTTPKALTRVMVLVEWQTRTGVKDRHGLKM